MHVLRVTHMLAAAAHDLRWAPTHGLRLASPAPTRRRQQHAAVHTAATAAKGAPPPPPPPPPPTKSGGDKPQRERLQPGELPRVVLKGGKAKLFTDQQSPMVYSGAVDRVVGRPAPQAGDAVLVCDGGDKPIGWGVYNPASMFRVRIMQQADEAFGGAAALRPDLRQLVAARVGQAVAARAAVGLRCGPDAGPGAATTVFRLVNSEGDRLSGLIVDVLGEHLVVASSAAWVEKHRDSICECLRQATGLDSVVWRPALDMLREEGLELGAPAGSGGEQATEASDHSAAAGGSEAAAEAAAQAGGAGAAEEAGGSGGAAAAPPTVVVVENGIQYLAAPHGQKTGFYADQRDSRAAVRQLAAGRRMLDLCCYSGGFALSAAAGGAADALGVDSSAPAVDLATRNAALNGLEGVVAFVRADVTAFMRQALAERRRWDLVVFDPPKLAPSRKALDAATRKYRKLNAMAMQLVEPGGLLMTCSCSGAMSQGGGYLPMLQAAARDAGRRITVLRSAGAGPDHTIDPAYPEGQYLTNMLVRVL